MMKPVPKPAMTKLPDRERIHHLCSRGRHFYAAHATRDSSFRVIQYTASFLLALWNSVGLDSLCQATVLKNISSNIAMARRAFRLYSLPTYGVSLAHSSAEADEDQVHNYAKMSGQWSMFTWALMDQCLWFRHVGLDLFFFFDMGYWSDCVWLLALIALSVFDLKAIKKHEKRGNKYEKQMATLDFYKHSSDMMIPLWTIGSIHPLLGTAGGIVGSLVRVRANWLKTFECPEEKKYH